jgi:hypothetical protein
MDCTAVISLCRHVERVPKVEGFTMEPPLVTLVGMVVVNIDIASSISRAFDVRANWGDNQGG